MFSKTLLNHCFKYVDNKDIYMHCEELDESYYRRIITNLEPDDRLFLSADNKNALRFDCGDYADGPCFTKDEICSFLDQINIPYKCYSIYPCLEYPQLIYSDEFLPNEELKIRYFPIYNHPENVFEIEEFKIDSLISKGVFHEKANAFIFECNTSGIFSDIGHITLSSDRYRDQAFITIIHDHNNVEKKALYPKGVLHLQQLNENMQELRKRGIPVVEGEMTNEKSYNMPYVSAPLATTYLKKILKKSKEEFIALFDRFVELILMSSDHIVGNENEIILAKGYLDMVPLNAFFSNEDFLFFDQEFYLEKCPAKAVIYRALLIPYCGDEEIEKLCPFQFMLDRYGLLDRWEHWHHYTEDFFRSLRDQKEWEKLQKKHGRNDIIMKGNQKIKEMQKESNCFSTIGDKEIYVFGTGRYADKFVDMYPNDYRIIGAIDNDCSKQGCEWKELTVYSAEEICNHKDAYVMICIKAYEPIIEQLKMLGVVNFGVYDAHHVYPGRQIDNIPYTGKLYHIGYCAGVYDLFHIGHVNIFRKAKEQCDYLIVGVVTDEGVRNNKHREPFIPYAERLEMVRSCRYVDEAVEIPYIYCRTPDMFEKYHFDVQFSGSDYENDPGWLAMKQYLNEHGAEMVFFPYTECTSSTKIKALIEKGLAE